MRQISKSLEDTTIIANQLVGLILKQIKTDQATVIGLYGDLGAGKTTLTQALAKSLGVKNRVVSPTFVIMKSYRLKVKSYKLLIHIDAYRLERPEELLNLGWAAILADPKNLILIEWPERVSSIMPLHTKVHFCHRGENCREIIINKVL